MMLPAYRSTTTEQLEPLRCINWPHLPAEQAPFCNKWHCPLPWHGWDVRKREARFILSLLPPDTRLLTCPLHLNRRLHGTAACQVATALRTSFNRATDGGVLVAFTHVEHSHQELSPVPHIHLGALTRGGVTAKRKGTSRVESFLESRATLQVLESWSRKAMGDIDLLQRYPDRELRGWQKAESVEATVLYLMRASKEFEWLPREQLPRSGDRYQQTYPGRANLAKAVGRVLW